MTQSNQFDPQAWVFGNQPSTTQTQSNSEQPAFDPQAWVFRNNANKDVTGLGSRYAENFNAQLSDRQANQGQRLNPVWKMQEYENFSKAMVEHYANQGYTPEQINTIQAEFAKLADPRKQNKWYEPFTDLGRSFAAGYSKTSP